jgi:hypothetical protein
MAIRGVYLFYTTGSYNGLNQTGFCVFDPTGKNNQISSAASTHSRFGKEIQSEPYLL